MRNIKILIRNLVASLNNRRPTEKSLTGLDITTELSLQLLDHMAANGVNITSKEFNAEEVDKYGRKFKIKVNKKILRQLEMVKAELRVVNSKTSQNMKEFMPSQITMSYLREHQLNQVFAKYRNNLYLQAKIRELSAHLDDALKSKSRKKGDSGLDIRDELCLKLMEYIKRYQKYGDPTTMLSPEVKKFYDLKSVRYDQPFTRGKISGEKVIDRMLKQNDVTYLQLRKSGILKSIGNLYPVRKKDLVIEAQIRDLAKRIHKVYTAYYHHTNVPLGQTGMHERFELYFQMENLLNQHSNYNLAKDNIPKETLEEMAGIKKVINIKSDFRETLIIKPLEESPGVLSKAKLELADQLGILESLKNFFPDRFEDVYAPVAKTKNLGQDELKVEFKKFKMDIGDTSVETDPLVAFNILAAKILDKHIKYNEIISNKKTFFGANKKRVETINHVSNMLVTIKNDPELDSEAKFKLLYGCIKANKDSVEIHQNEKDILAKLGLRKLFRKTDSRLVSLYNDVLKETEEVAHRAKVDLSSAKNDFKEKYKDDIEESFSKGYGL
jgi:hypothetical protein